MLQPRHFMTGLQGRIPGCLELAILLKKARNRVTSRWTHKKLRICNAFGCKIVVPLHFRGIGKTLITHGYRELDQMYILRKIMKPGMRIVEVGANIGFHIPIYSKMTNGDFEVFAIEPDPRNQEALKANIKLSAADRKVTLKQWAASDYNGKAILQLAEATNLSSLGKSGLPVKYVGETECEVVAFYNVLMQCNEAVDLVRMDIEGHELKVLRSLISMAESGEVGLLPRGILFECHQWTYTDELGQNAMEDVLNKMLNIGYKARFVCTALEHYSPLRKLGFIPKVIIQASPNRVHGVYEDLPNDVVASIISREPSINRVYFELKRLR